MVRAGEVIAQCLRDVPAQEDASRILDLVQHAEGVFHADFQMFRRDDVAGLNGLVQVGADDDLAVVVHAGAGDGGAGQLRDLDFQLRLHGFGQRFAVGHEDGAGQLVVLGLAQQVCRHPGRVTPAVCQHQDLAGAGDHVDAHLAEDLPLGRGHVDIAGADDLIHGRDALGAVGQRRHRLCAAGLEDLRHARRSGSGQDDRVHPAVLSGGGGHDDLRHPGHLSRDDIHQHRRRISRRAAGHIDARLFDGGVFLAQHHAGLVVHHKILVHLLAVEGLDVGSGLLQRFQEIGVHVCEGLVDLRLGHLQFFDGRAIEFQGVFLQGRIAAGADVGKDAVHDILHILFGADVPVQNFFRSQFVKLVQLDHFAASCKVSRSCSSIRSTSRCLNW